MFVTTALSPAALDSWGWRVPFALGLLIAPVGIYIARHLEETDEFVATQTAARPPPLMAQLAHQLRGILVTFGLIVGATISYYVILVYMPTFAQKELHLPLAAAFRAQVIALLCLTVMIPLVGALSDWIGRRPLLIAGTLALLIALYPLFERVHTTPTFHNLLLMQVSLCTLLGIYYGPLSTTVAEQFPPGVRSVGLSLAYNLAVMLFGGFAQFIVTWLIKTTGNPLAAAYYVMFGAAVGLVAACCVRPAMAHAAG